MSKCFHIGVVTISGESDNKTYYESDQPKKMLQFDHHYWINVRKDYPHDLPAVGEMVRADITLSASPSRQEGRENYVDYYPYLARTTPFDPFS